jgi:GTPase SAR1 family protein
MSNHIVVVAGAPKVGTSSLICRFVDDEFLNEIPPQQEVRCFYFSFLFLFLLNDFEQSFSKCIEVDKIPAEFIIVESKIQQIDEIVKSLGERNPDAFVIVYSMDDRNSLNEAQIFRDRILHHFQSDRFPMVLVGTKKDVAVRQVSTNEVAKLAMEWGIPFLEVSAKDGSQVEEVFKTCAELSLKYPWDGGIQILEQ